MSLLTLIFYSLCARRNGESPSAPAGSAGEGHARGFKVRKSKPQHARKLVKVIYATLMSFEGPEGMRSGDYISAVVRFRGIWRDWRDAGLQHLHRGCTRQGKRRPLRWEEE